MVYCFREVSISIENYTISQIKYAVVFDAGSSGTRQYVYEWNADYTSKNNDQLNIKQISSCNTDGMLLLYVLISFIWFK